MNSIHEHRITEDIRSDIRDNGTRISDEKVVKLLKQRLLNDDKYSDLSISEKIRISDTAFYRTRRDLSVLQPIADDDAVSEIMVNGKDNVFIERNGKLEKVEISFESTDELEEVIRRIAAKIHREINELSPILDARLEDGSRVNAVYKNIALEGPILTIRRFPKSRIGMKELLAFETLSEESALFLDKLVRSAYNIFISGGTSSGKTTFLNALAGLIPKHERIITIEDSAELQITGIDNLVRLECRIANTQERGAVTMRQLIRTSLRRRPNRIIVGEVRGEEVLDMIQAMNTGHDGSLSTGHGNSPRGMLYRLEAMFLQAADFPVAAIRRQITEGLDILVHLGRLPDGSRRVLEISEIAGMRNGEIELNRLYEYDSKIASLKSTGNTLIDKTKLEVKGIAL